MPTDAPATPADARRVRMFCVDESGEGQRLDNFLLRELKGVPQTHIYRIIRSGEVRVNKGRAAADHRLASGDQVRVPPVRLAPSSAVHAPAAPPREFPVLLEDEVLLAIDKPAGTAVHGGSGLSFGVIEQLRGARPEARFLELVHRLDRETSGVLLLAKRRSALTHLQAQFRQRSTGKTYLALVQGQWPDNRKVIDIPLARFHLPSADGRAEGERRVRTTTPSDQEGQRAITLVKVRQRYDGYTLLEVTIRTGRTHQIRVHLAASGHPIVGDDKYGDFELNRRLQRAPSQAGGIRLSRMFLHAWRLQFDHPVSGARVELAASLPAELQGFVDAISPPAAPAAST